MKVGKLYAYRINPIDFGWEYLTEVSVHRERLAKEFAHGQTPNDRQYLLKKLRDFEAFIDTAMNSGEAVGWEGDFRVEPHLGFLPVEGSVTAYCVWKQDNNGDSFVVSPFEMPWLDGISY